jgi:hypothetical protein
MTIGLSGLPGLVDLRGEADLFDYRLRVTQVAASDELAAGASLVMGQAREGRPLVLARGFPYPLREGCLSELTPSKEADLFQMSEMYAIISELDKDSSVVVKDLWARLRDACGLRAIYDLPTPHFTWFVAESLDLPLCKGDHG